MTKEQINAYDARASERDVQRIIANNLISQIFGCFTFKDGGYSFDREIIEIDTSAGDLMFIHLDNGQTFSVRIEEK